jgi:hypothetical protein
VLSPELGPIHRRIEALEQFNRDTRLLVLDQTLVGRQSARRPLAGGGCGVRGVRPANGGHGGRLSLRSRCVPGRAPERQKKRGATSDRHGAAEPVELPELYQSARIFVFPSLQENFPMVLLEAMAAGCAVLTTSAPGCVEVVGDGAMLVEPGNSVALKNALARLLADEAAIERMRAASRLRVRRFASVRVADQFAQLFQNCGALRPSDLSHSLGRGRLAARS